jgi:hypothetical protein
MPASDTLSVTDPISREFCPETDLSIVLDESNTPGLIVIAQSVTVNYFPAYFS